MTPEHGKSSQILPIIPDDGKKVYADITDQMETAERERLEAMLQHQALLLDQVSDAIISTDENFVITSWNRGAERIYGWKAEEVIGKPSENLLHTHYLSGTLQDVMSGFTANGHWEGEVEQRRKDGSVVPILSAVTLLRNDDGELIGVVGVNRDITNLRSSEAERRVAEQRYRHLFDRAPVMYLALEDQDGDPIIRDVNNFYLQRLGYTREEVVGRNAIDFLDPDSRQVALHEYPKIVRGTDKVAVRILRSRDGERIEALMRAAPEFDKEGQVVGFLTMYTDLSPLRQSEQRLRVEAGRVQTLLRIVSRLNRQADLMSLMQTVCTEVSVALDVPGVSLSLVDKEKGVFVHGADVGLPLDYERLTQSVAIPSYLQGDMHDVELIRINPIDTLVDSPNYAMYVEQGLQIGVNVMLVRDAQMIGSLNLHITDPQRQFGPDDLALLRGIADVVTQAILNAQLREETLRYASHLQELVNERTMELEEALAQAQEADRLKSQFVSDINHELRTPLTNIILYLGLLTNGKPEKRAQAIAIMQREAQRLRQMIEDVLDLSRLDLDRTEMHAQTVLLSELVEGLIEDREPLIEGSSLQFSFHAEPELPPISVDASLVGRVITNLLDNAFKYTAQGEVRILVNHRWVDNIEWQTISVADSGPGIDPEDLPNLFLRFYRGQSARQSGTSGTGLGLAICQELAELHGGHITVETEYGKGSTFTLWLPGERA